jgi:hypothetical protein
MTIKMTLTRITPEVAQRYLDRNLRNRHLVDDRVERFAAIIRRGEWKVTHQGVALDEEGGLVDGQHRLAAIVRANKPVSMFVATGVTDFAVIDVGKPRTAGDILGIAGHNQATYLAAALRLLACYESGHERPWYRFKNQYTPAEIAKIAEVKGDAVAPYIAPGRATRARIGGSAAAYTAALYVIGNWAAAHNVTDLFDDWTTGLTTGAGLDKGDARLALASWVANAGKLVHSTTRSELTLMLTLRSFYAHITGESMYRLLVRNMDTFIYRLPDTDLPAHDDTDTNTA